MAGSLLLKAFTVRLEMISEFSHPAMDPEATISQRPRAGASYGSASKADSAHTPLSGLLYRPEDLRERSAPRP